MAQPQKYEIEMDISLTDRLGKGWAAFYFEQCFRPCQSSTADGVTVGLQGHVMCKTSLTY